MKQVEKIAIAGMGLIGGSFYKAARAAGYDAVGLHHGESAGLDAADLVIVALPITAIVPWIKAHAADFKRGAVVVDAGGVKAEIVRAMAEVPQTDWHFVGGHPMAGKEVSGYANSTPDLFRGASMILTPPDGTDAALLAALATFFTKIGFAQTVVTTPEKHDAMIAFTSQLCHVIASAYAQDERVTEAIGFTAGSYANMTRIATMDPAGWAALFLSDRAALLDVLDGFKARLDVFRSALARADRPALEEFIQKGAQAKERELAARKERNV